jgi:hypothetical protein
LDTKEALPVVVVGVLLEGVVVVVLLPKIKPPGLVVVAALPGVRPAGVVVVAVAISNWPVHFAPMGQQAIFLPPSKVQTEPAVQQAPPSAAPSVEHES